MTYLYVCYRGVGFASSTAILHASVLWAGVWLTGLEWQYFFQISKVYNGMLVAKKERSDTYASKLNPSYEVLNHSHKYCLSQPHPAHAAGYGAGPEVPL